MIFLESARIGAFAKSNAAFWLRFSFVFPEPHLSAGIARRLWVDTLETDLI